MTVRATIRSISCASFAARDTRVRVVELARNFGQHSAMLAGFRNCRGEIVVTLDADLQNPPEEIPRLIEAIDAGNDVVGGWREERQDRAYRRLASRLHNRLTSVIVGVPMHDYGCMLRAYRRHIVETVVECDEKAAFVPALANSFAKRVAEIPVGHAERAGGESKYNLFSLAHLSLNLITGFSMLADARAEPHRHRDLPARCDLRGASCSGHRVIYGPQQEGALWTLFAVLFFFVGLMFLALGLIGEYVGRIYLEVRRRPNYIVRAVHGDERRRRHVLTAAPLVTAAEDEFARAAEADVATPDACSSPTTRWVMPASRRCSRWARRSPRCSRIAMPPARKSGGVHARELAGATSIPVYTPRRSAPESKSRRSLRCIPRSSTPSIIATCSRREFIEFAPLGAFNLHGSLLPKYRGRAPVNWMLVNGETRGRRDAASYGRARRRRRYRGAARGADH